MQRLLLNELDHGIKNTLATVQAIAGSPIRASRTIDDFQQAFYGRTATLSKTHSLLTDNQQRFVPLRQLLKNELEIYEDREGQRIILSGPDVMLPADISVTFAMAIHELKALKIWCTFRSCRRPESELDVGRDPSGTEMGRIQRPYRPPNQFVENPTKRRKMVFSKASLGFAAEQYETAARNSQT